MSRLLWIIAFLVLVVGGIWFYKYTDSQKDKLGSGLVISHDSDTKDASETAASTPEPLPPNPPIGDTSSKTTTAAPPTQPTPPIKPTAYPVSDTIDRNPPNGTVFTATGDFTWYRQGDITWRVNSKTGASCIAFATMEEWRKRIVYTNGCRNA